MPFRILFVCMGNICRSPAAHCVFQHMVDEAGLSQYYEIESAGTHGYHIGNPPDSRMISVLRQNDVPAIGQAREISPQDLNYYDLILCMDDDNLANVQSLARNHPTRARITRFVDYCQQHKLPHVPDPYYGGDDGFHLVFKQIKDGCSHLLEETKAQIQRS